MRDLISRQAAIDDIWTVSPLARLDRKWVDRWLRQLPSAQPTFDARDTQYNLPIGTDLISRQQAIDALDKRFDNIPMEQTTEILQLRRDLRQLPSAEPEPSQVARDIARIVENEQDMRILPKRGKWIPDRSGAYCCSECMEPCATYVMMRPRDKFCKMCGAKMEVTE